VLGSPGGAPLHDGLTDTLDLLLRAVAGAIGLSCASSGVPLGWREHLIDDLRNKYQRPVWRGFVSVNLLHELIPSVIGPAKA